MAPPQKMRTRYREIMRRLSAGQTNKEIADRLGMTQSRLSVIIRSPLFQAELEKIESRLADSTVDFQLRLKQYAEEAMTTNIELMRSSASDSIRQKSAFDILDRAGIGQRNAPSQPTTNYSVNQFNLSSQIVKGDPELIGALKKLTENHRPIEV